MYIQYNIERERERERERVAQNNNLIPESNPESLLENWTVFESEKMYHEDVRSYVNTCFVFPNMYAYMQYIFDFFTV